MSKLKDELKTTINFFKERDKYKVDLKGWIKKYGIAGLPESVQRTIPTDLKVLYELPWQLQLVVWIRIFQIAWLNIQNKGLKKVVNG